MTSFDANSTTYDNTRLSDYKECPRKYYIRHILHWRSAGTAKPLVFGLSWHDAMDVVWTFAKQFPANELRELAFARFCETWEEWGFPVQMDLAQMDQYKPRTPGVANEMLHNYINTRWKMLQDCEVLAVEQPFAVPIPGMDGVWYVGRLDKVVKYNGSITALEHKTTSLYRVDGGFAQEWTESWYASSQVKGYEFAGALYFPGLRDVWIDGSLVHAKVHDKFKFIPVSHSFPLIQEWLTTTHSWINKVERAKKELVDHGVTAFQKNEDSCYGKYGTCPYLDICRTCADPTKLDSVPEGFIEEKWEPFDLLKLEQLVQQGDNK